MADDTTTADSVVYYRITDVFQTDNWPSFLPQFGDSAALQNIYLLPIDVLSSDTTLGATTGLFLVDPLVLSLPGLDAVSLVLSPKDDGTVIPFTVTIQPSLSFQIGPLPIALRIQSNYFKPAKKVTDDSGADHFEVDPDKQSVDITLGTVTLTFSDENGVSFDGTQSIDLPPSMIGDTGVAVEATGLQLFLGGSLTPSNPPGRPAGSKGLLIPSATIHLPGSVSALGSAITITNAFIGNGGFSGTVQDTFNGELHDLGGLQIALDAISLTFVQNSLTESSITGLMKLPFFEKSVQVQVAIGIDGGFGITVVGVAPGDGSFDPNTGLLTLNAEVLTFTISKLAFEVDQGLATVKVTGQVQPDAGGLDWPKFDVKELSIDSQGHVTLNGGWIDLPKQLGFNLYGFSMEITKIGFGKQDDTHRWIGFSGGVKIADGIQAGASVDGLRIVFGGGDVSVTCDGVEVDFENAALSIKGAVSLKSQEFSGGVKLVLKSVGLTIDGQFVAGTLPTGETTFAIFVHGELPAGIPLGGSGLAIYGFAGLYALNREPDKHDDEEWYSSPDGTKPGWYLRTVPGTTSPGVADLAKWRGKAGRMGFGAGITIGTFSDNGYEFSGRVLLVLVFPGPLVILEGKANLFKKRADLEGDDPTFRALAVLDPGKSFQLDLDAHYKYRSGGELMDLRGSAEAFFDFQHGDGWFINIGLKDDPKRRVRASIFKLFDVSAYFQLNPHELDIGGAASYDKSWGFSHLNVHLGASLEAAATVSWHPNHFTGAVTLAGVAELRAFGHGTGVQANATISGDVFDPFHLKGSFKVGIGLRWPLPDISKTITLEWSDNSSAKPVLPLPLREASVELPGWATPTANPSRPLRWPFERGTNLVPSYDQGEGEFTHGSAPGPDTFDFANALVVPADAQVGLTFSRPVDDPGQLGANPTVLAPDVIGDPVNSKKTDGYRVGYKLVSVTLEKVAARSPSETAQQPLPQLPPEVAAVVWVRVGQAGQAAQDGVAQIFGAWTRALPSDNPQNPADTSVAVPTNNEQVKLMINAKTPFGYTALADKQWDDWVAGADPGYPCVPFDPNEKLVAVFDQPSGTRLEPPFDFDNPAFEISWDYGGDITDNEVQVTGVQGPLTSGLRLATFADADGSGRLLFVTPPSGNPEAHLRVGTPAVLDHSPFDRGRFFNTDIGSQPNPLTMLDASTSVQTFEGTGNARVPLPSNEVVKLSDNTPALELGFSNDIIPPVPALIVELELDLVTVIGFGDPGTSAAPDPTELTVAAFAADGTPGEQQPIENGRNTMRLHATSGPIAKVVVTGSSGEGVALSLTRLYVRTPVTAVAFSPDPNGVEIGRFQEQEGLITVTGTELGPIFLGTSAGGEFVLLELSLPSRTDVIIRHVVESLDRFTEDDPVFEPETNYRLTIQTSRAVGTQSQNAGGVLGDDTFTEKVYFRTAPLPGLGVPDVPAGTQVGTNQEAPDPNQTPLTGFEDLGFYVTRTIPAVPPSAGGHTSPARAVYRAYDVNVEFSPDTIHVQRMYRIGRRDLTLRLFDGTDRPLLDDDGRVIVPDSVWGQSADPTISDAASRWIGVVNQASCRPTPPPADFQPLHREVLAAPAQAQLLAPETLHQARLVPMLLHETFEDARTTLVADGQNFQLDGWHAEQDGPNPSAWVVQSETTTDTAGDTVTTWFATEQNQLESSLVYHGPLTAVQQTSRLDHPSQWNDLRASVEVRWQAGEIGFDVRRASSTQLVRVTLLRDQTDPQQVTLTLQSLGGNPDPHPVEATLTVLVDEDLTILVECVGPQIDVFAHGPGETATTPLVSFTTGPVFTGGVALFSSGGVAPRFTDLRVHDLRPDPATAFRFDFVSSRYADFTDHLGSFDDTVLGAPATLGLVAADITAARPAGVPVTSPGSSDVGLPVVPDAEDRAFEALSAKTLGAPPQPDPERVEIVRASQDPSLFPLLVRTREPMVWERTSLLVSAASVRIGLEAPADLKLTAVTFGATPIAESAVVLVRERASLGQHRIDWRPLGDPSAAWTPYFTFPDEPALPDGTAVHIFSGSADEAPPVDPGTAQRFVATDSTTASVVFPAAGVELRLVSPDGTAVHQRQFLPDGAYTPRDMTIVRKQDGTAFFLLPPDGATPPPALRLTFTFTRNFGAARQDAPVLRQGGSDTAEVVSLDLELAP